MPIPLAVRLKAKNLYLVQCLEPALIALQTGLTRQQIWQLASREKWVEIRREKVAAAKADLDQRASLPLDEVTDAIVRECDQHSLTALDRTGKSLSSRSKFAARDAQAFSGTLRNLVQVSRACRGLENARGLDPASSISMNFFLARPVKRVIETKGVCASQVIDVSPVSIPALQT
jgi:hypothetical protein